MTEEADRLKPQCVAGATVFEGLKWIREGRDCPAKRSKVTRCYADFPALPFTVGVCSSYKNG